MRNDFVRRRFEKKFEIDREISYDHTISSSNLIDCVHCSICVRKEKVTNIREVRGSIVSVHKDVSRRKRLTLFFRGVRLLE